MVLGGLIDHIISKNLNKKFESFILTSKISDHFPIFFTTFNLKPADNIKYLNVRDFSKKNVNNFKNDLSRISWNDVYNLDNVHDSFNNFSQTFNDLYELRFPERKIKFNKNFHKIQKWMTQGLLVSRLTKIKLGKNSIKTSKLTKIIATFTTHLFVQAKNYFLNNNLLCTNLTPKRLGNLSI